VGVDIYTKLLSICQPIC